MPAKRRRRRISRRAPAVITEAPPRVPPRRIPFALAIIRDGTG